MCRTRVPGDRHHRALPRGVEGPARSPPHLRHRRAPHSGAGRPLLDLRRVQDAHPGIFRHVRGVLDREGRRMGLPALPHGLGAVPVRAVQVFHQRGLARGYHGRFPSGIRGEGSARGTACAGSFIFNMLWHINGHQHIPVYSPALYFWRNLENMSLQERRFVLATFVHQACKKYYFRNRNTLPYHRYATRNAISCRV